MVLQGWREVVKWILLFRDYEVVKTAPGGGYPLAIPGVGGLTSQVTAPFTLDVGTARTDDGLGNEQRWLGSLTL